MGRASVKHAGSGTEGDAVQEGTVGALVKTLVGEEGLLPVGVGPPVDVAGVQLAGPNPEEKGGALHPFRLDGRRGDAVVAVQPLAVAGGEECPEKAGGFVAGEGTFLENLGGNVGAEPIRVGGGQFEVLGLLVAIHEGERETAL